MLHEAFGGVIANPVTSTLPEGGRLSEPCVAARFAGWLDPTRVRPFDQGISEAGYAGEFWFLAFKLRPVDPSALTRFLAGERLVREPLQIGGVVTTQYPIPWGEGDAVYGITHPDFVVEGGPLEATWELKTSGAETWERITPSSDNRSQVKRRRRAIERRGITLPPDQIAIIRKADQFLSGPFGVELTDDDRASIDAEFALFHSFALRAETIDLDLDGELRDACTCSCYAPPREYMQDLESLIDFQLHEMLTVPRTHEAWKPYEKDRKRLLAAAKDVIEAAGKTHVETAFYDLTLTKAGALVCKAKKELAAA